MTTTTEPAQAAGADEMRGGAGAAGLPPVPPELADAIDEQLVRQLAGRAEAAGLSLTGEGGLLQRLTKIVLEGRSRRLT